jgi:hypothetical protein
MLSIKLEVLSFSDFGEISEYACADLNKITSLHLLRCFLENSLNQSISLLTFTISSVKLLKRLEHCSGLDSEAISAFNVATSLIFL